MVALVRQIIKLEDGTEIYPNNNVRILAMDWQVCDSTSFKNPILKSENDTKNLSSIIFTDILDPGTKWYARARALIKDSGWTVWGNLDVMRYENSKDLYQYTIIPSRVSTPKITTSSNPSNHDAILFTIFASGFSVVGNATHSATSWFIEDIDGNVIWSDLEDTVNLTQVEFNSMLLSNNTIYRIRAMFHSSSGDVSSIGSYTVLVGGDNIMEIITYLDDVNWDTDIDVEAVYLDKDANVTGSDWQIISMANNYAEIIYNKSITGEGYGKITIPASTLKDDTLYILKVRPIVDSVNGNWKYIIFKTISKSAFITTLIVTPNLLSLFPNDTSILNVHTLADDYTYSIDNPGVFKYDKASCKITALAVGQGNITFSAQEADKESMTASVKVVVKSSTISYKVTYADTTGITHYSGESNDSLEYSEVLKGTTKQLIVTTDGTLDTLENLNPTVATINKNTLILSTLEVGTAKFKFTFTGDGLLPVTATLEINVVPDIDLLLDGVTIENSSVVNVVSGDTIKIEVK